MGLFSGLGKIVGGIFGGPIGGAIGGVVGGGIDSSKDEKRAAQQKANYYVDLAANAERGGFNKYAVLQNGGGAGYGAVAAPRLRSTTAMDNSFDQLDKLLSGKQAEEDKRQEVEDEIRRTQLDELRRGVTPGTGTISTNNPTPETEDSPYFDKNGEMHTFYGGPKIEVAGPYGPISIPNRLAAQIGLEPGMALLPGMLEELAGDEISQAVFGDWLIEMGVNIRRDKATGKNNMSIGDMIQAAKNKIFGSNPNPPTYGGKKGGRIPPSTKEVPPTPTPRGSFSPLTTSPGQSKPRGQSKRPRRQGGK